MVSNVVATFLILCSCLRGLQKNPVNARSRKGRQCIKISANKANRSAAVSLMEGLGRYGGSGFIRIGP